MGEFLVDFVRGEHRKPRIIAEDWEMNSHEARALLRDNDTHPSHNNEAIRILLCDIHEWVEQMRAQMEHAGCLETAEKSSPER